MDIQAVRALVEKDMEAVNQRIQERLRSDTDLIQQVGYHIVNSGGKRLRPILTLLMSRAWGYEGDDHIELAAVVEFIHTATLLHDDVVDASLLRRGQETANAIWGNEAPVLVGDFLYSKSLQMLADLGNLRFVEIFADAVSTISEGEVIQLLNRHKPDVTEAQYQDVIHRKTAMLFGTGAHVAAVLNKTSSTIEKDMVDYGLHLGTAFQLIDDVLDYSGSTEEIGKNLGDDLAEGKPTLPLIYAMREGSKAQSDTIREAIIEGGRDRIDIVTQIIQETGALEFTEKAAVHSAQQAIEKLAAVPDNQYKDAMIAIAEFSAQRNH